MFDSYIEYQARLRPTAPAVVAMGGSVSFAKFNGDIDRAVLELQELDAVEGEAVTVDVADPYLHWVVVLALARIGLASAPPADLGWRLRVADARSKGTAAALVLGPAIIGRIVDGPPVTVRPLRPRAEILGRILQSSGTTGEEKRVGMSWRVIDAGIRNAVIAYGAPDGSWLASETCHAAGGGGAGGLAPERALPRPATHGRA